MQGPSRAEGLTVRVQGRAGTEDAAQVLSAGAGPGHPFPLQVSGRTRDVYDGPALTALWGLLLHSG